VVVDGYHSFMAIDRPFAGATGAGATGAGAFFLAGGYKYAMSGEGMGLMHCPPGFGERPPLTGWYAEFEDLTLPPGRVGYARDAMRFMGATFDPSALYRFNRVREMLAGAGLDTTAISAHVERLHERLVQAVQGTPLGGAELLNPLDGASHARFLAFRSKRAEQWCAELAERDCITDVRGDVLRVGLGLYHDETDIDRFVALARALG
jgi:selenocysteine lyase/cysteine desulfurase